MTTLKHSIVLLASALAAAAANGQSDDFRWGVNGHPYVQEGYRDVPVADQLDLVAELGADWYRCDWYQGRLEKSPESFDALVDEAERRGLRILPVIFPSTGSRSDATPERIRAESAKFARALVSRYRGRIAYWELDNELDLVAMVRRGETCRDGVVWKWGDPSGDRPEHYEESRYRKVEAELRGLYEGVRSADADALTIVDAAGWLHYGFFERLVNEDRVPFDILGWHWYSEMGDMTRVRGDLDVLERLRGYGKPIWITEINRRGGSMGGKEREQADYVTRAARQLRVQKGVKAFFIYELLDEPYFSPENPESHYGLVGIARGPNGGWRVGPKKQAFRDLREVIRETRNAAHRDQGPASQMRE